MKTPHKTTSMTIAAILIGGASSGIAVANSARDGIIKGFATEAQAAFSAPPVSRLLTSSLR